VSLGTNAEISKETIVSLETFVCSMYGKKKLSSVDEIRLELFLQKYKPKGKDEALACVKKFDGSSLPPCSRVLYEKIRRTKYIAELWLSSTSPAPPDQLPEEMGWQVVDGHYTVNWFDGEVSPKPIDITSNEDEFEDVTEEGKPILIFLILPC
jgi:hypothetical protein